MYVWNISRVFLQLLPDCGDSVLEEWEHGTYLLINCDYCLEIKKVEWTKVQINMPTSNRRITRCHGGDFPSKIESR